MNFMMIIVKITIIIIIIIIITTTTTHAFTCATAHSILSPTPPIISAFPPKIMVDSRAHSSRTFEASACEAFVT